jgi:methionyl-tRNA synthetase
MEPVIPGKAEAVWVQLGDPRSDTPLAEALEPLKVGTPLEKPSPIFEQIPDELIEELSEMVAERIAKASG